MTTTGNGARRISATNAAPTGHAVINHHVGLHDEALGDNKGAQ